MAAYCSGPEYDSDEDEEEVEDCFLKEEFQRLTDLIQGNTCPGDFSCSGWFWFSVGRFFLIAINVNFSPNITFRAFSKG